MHLVPGNLIVLLNELQLRLILSPDIRLVVFAGLMRSNVHLGDVVLLNCRDGVCYLICHLRQNLHGLVPDRFVTWLMALMLNRLLHWLVLHGRELNWLLDTGSLDCRSMMLHRGRLVRRRRMMGGFVLISVLVFVLCRDRQPCK